MRRIGWKCQERERERERNRSTNRRSIRKRRGKCEQRKGNGKRRKEKGWREHSRINRDRRRKTKEGKRKGWRRKGIKWHRESRESSRRGRVFPQVPLVDLDFEIGDVPIQEAIVEPEGYVPNSCKDIHSRMQSQSLTLSSDCGEGQDEVSSPSPLHLVASLEIHQAEDLLLPKNTTVHA